MRPLLSKVQLATHDERGHVFTERLLHARGRRESWFMGAGTMRPLLGRVRQPHDAVGRDQSGDDVNQHLVRPRPRKVETRQLQGDHPIKPTPTVRLRTCELAPPPADAPPPAAEFDAMAAPLPDAPQVLFE